MALCTKGMDANLHFEFPTLKSIRKPVGASVKRSLSTAAQEIVGSLTQLDTGAGAVPATTDPGTHSNTNTSHMTSPTTTILTSSSSSTGGVVLVTPLLLAAASGKWKVFRELLWREADCK